MEFSKPQMEMLQRKIMSFQIAKAQLDEFVEYLKKEHNVPADAKIKNDMSGFEDGSP